MKADHNFLEIDANHMLAFLHSVFNLSYTENSRAHVRNLSSLITISYIIFVKQWVIHNAESLHFLNTTKVLWRGMQMFEP